MSTENELVTRVDRFIFRRPDGSLYALEQEQHYSTGFGWTGEGECIDQQCHSQDDLRGEGTPPTDKQRKEIGGVDSADILVGITEDIYDQESANNEKITWLILDYCKEVFSEILTESGSVDQTIYVFRKKDGALSNNNYPPLEDEELLWTFISGDYDLGGDHSGDSRSYLIDEHQLPKGSFDSSDYLKKLEEAGLLAEYQELLKESIINEMEINLDCNFQLQSEKSV